MLKKKQFSIIVVFQTSSFTSAAIHNECMHNNRMLILNNSWFELSMNELLVAFNMSLHVLKMDLNCALSENIISQESCVQETVATCLFTNHFFIFRLHR